MKTPFIITAITLLLVACTTDEPVPVPPPPVPSQDHCPEGFGAWGEILDGCYAQLEDADWRTAEALCEKFESRDVSAHLVVPDREIEHRVLSELARQTVEGVWTAGLETGPQGEYRFINWVVPDVTYWAAGEPNDYGEHCDIFGCTQTTGDERCLEYSHLTGLWNDEKCRDPAIVLCEWDGVGPYDWDPYDKPLE